MSEEGKEIDHMDKVDQNPKAHADSTPEELEMLAKENGEADANGNFTAPVEDEEGVPE